MCIGTSGGPQVRYSRVRNGLGKQLPPEAVAVIPDLRTSAMFPPPRSRSRAMKYRRFGRTGWQVGEIGYGMWGMAGWTGSDDDESLTGLQLSVDLGCNFFDTAWAYGDGHSERLLGKLIAANPGKTLYAATKIPPKNRQWPSRRGSKLD